MTKAPEKSIEDLRENSERHREDLAATVDELRQRIGGTATELKTLLSPSHIKEEIRDHIRQERDSLVGAVKRQAKENPLQVVAVAAAVAYPAFRLLRALPTPLWLIGAGLFLTSQRGRQATADVRARVDEAVQQGTEKVSDLASSIRSDLQDRVAGARYGAEEARDAITSAVGGMADKARAVVHDARDSMSGMVEEGTAKATAAADSIRSSVSETAQTLKNRTQDTARTSRRAVIDFVNDNALLVAGVSVAVGALIAASIPSSEAENKLFGAGSQKLKDKARDVAARGIETVGDLAADTAGAVAASAAREGLDATGVQGAINKVADSVRTVADRGLNTALGNKHSAETPQAFEQPSVERNTL